MSSTFSLDKLPSFKPDVNSEFETDKDTRRKAKFCPIRIDLKFVAAILVLLGVAAAFVIYPVISAQKSVQDVIGYDTGNDEETLKKIALKESSKGQPLVPNPLPIDPDTPESGKTFTASTGEVWKLVFSDEFNKDGRSFEPGKDKVWVSQDYFYWPTNDLEYYSPKNVKTSKGSLVLTMEEKSTDGGHNFTSGMVSSWNKFCFQGGYIEVNVSFPGNGRVSGYWPAVWTLGNLGRAGYGATTDGLWPYTYNSCDEGVLPNQTISDPTKCLLRGQRLNACVCSGDHPSPGIGRGAPEIDIFEGSINGDELPNLSMSNQWAPFNFEYKNYNEGTLVFDRGYNVSGKSVMNDYTGNAYQQCASGLYFYDRSIVEGKKYQTFGFEYEPGPDGYIQWYSNRKPIWKLTTAAMGPNAASKIARRVISEEPMVRSLLDV
ncbi:putative beta-glucan synthesis-associated protein [Zancudomyces culisetae]|uniref:Putative beta-glucan synthesis-associated protein n=1 Tax=Zancudomyces culisetae TaxID=1213189 RepID=A0A1R1PPK7_ZANCU|nr:putative beta-glucan synthesis-associated protein [Zancudomyces culisetae]|eukprot:OMH82812.1 putative beta-glucan synthesis-associated protein [Zancudomyces culisetae]